MNTVKTWIEKAANEIFVTPFDTRADIADIIAAHAPDVEALVDEIARLKTSNMEYAIELADLKKEMEALAQQLDTILTILKYGEQFGIRLFYSTDGAQERDKAIDRANAALAAYREKAGQR